MTTTTTPATPQTIQTYTISLIRTFTPILVGILAGFITNNLGWTIGNETLTAADTQITLAVTALWYAGIRALEIKWPPIGILLGWPTPPNYTNTPPTTTPTNQLQGPPVAAPYVPTGPATDPPTITPTITPNPL